MYLASRQLKKVAPTLRYFSTGYQGIHYENIKAEVKEGGVGLVTLTRPKALNALCDALFAELNDATSRMDQDDKIGCIVLTGSEKAFAAGADIKEMASKEWPQTYNIDMLHHWENIARLRTPTLAAVNGYALGGGCELAMMCDIIYCGSKAMFGQPEINLGTIPGMGGSQRLTRAIGKSRAMEMILTGEYIKGEEAVRLGLASKQFDTEKLVEEAIKTAANIASKSPVISKMAKDVVNEAFETGLQSGLKYERRIFHSTFGTKDRAEGMDAFVNKRNPTWTNE